MSESQTGAALAGPADGRLWPSAEQRLLLRAALLDGALAESAFREWRSRVDVEQEFGWQSLRLIPLVYHNLARLGVHDPVMSRFKGVYRRAWYETHQLLQRTMPAVEAIAAAGLDPVLLKGVPLVADYYRNHALRPMSDLDLLVRPSDALAAVGILQRLGWRPTSEPTPDRYRFFHALQFVHPDGGEIDLHWHVMYESCADGADERMLAGVEPLMVGGVTVRQLAPTPLLLQLVVHGVRWNLETPIRWVPDTLMVLRTRGADVDWDGLLRLARELRVSRRLAMGLAYLHEHLDAPVPSRVLDDGRRGRASAVERIENSVILRDTLRIQQRALGTQWVIAADLARLVDPGRHPFRYVRTYPHYLRFRWALNGRRDIVPMLARAVFRRLRGRSASHRLVDVR